ncbi:MAG: toll/interleukin-1 receptor domain-containing protein [Vulcanimicrobiaceae bacterium]|jgi:hypothetical protein
MELAGRPSVISYVRGSHDAKVLALAERLNTEGVPCDLDLFDPRPKGGWSRWMTEKMTGIDVVLVVCSQDYHKRYHLEQEDGIGKGVSFEGGMLGRRVLEAQGSEHGVVPIVFDRADLQWIPEFLRDETPFVLPEQFDDLYRVLTRQPAFVKPQLGKVRLMPPISGIGSSTVHETVSTPTSSARGPIQSLPLTVFYLERGKFVFGHYTELVRTDRKIDISLLVEDDEDAAHFSELQAEREALPIAWSLTGTRGRLRTYREVHREGRRLVELTLAEDPPRSSFADDVNFNGISAHQIALRRARRILLNERSPVNSELGMFSSQRMTEDMLEHYVSGSSGRGNGIKTSPIPEFARSPNEEALKLEAMRLVCVLFLTMTRTVERILRLELRFVTDGVAVDFKGVRARQAMNVDPTTLTVTGTCPLS